MVLGSRSEPLSQLEVLVVDCQATAAAPRGHLLEIGWARASRTTITHADASLIALPDGEQIPPAVARITGISERMMAGRCRRTARLARASDQAASLTHQPAPTVIHFARFEQPFLRMLSAGVFPFDVVCTRDIARRLLPDLPRCSLRALAGYFGRAVGALRRSADLSARSPEPTPHRPIGPFPSAETLDQFVALAQGDCAALTSSPRGPNASTFNAGYELLRATHAELSGVDLSAHAKLLRLGTRLWREGRRDRDVVQDDTNDVSPGLSEWTPEFVQVSLEWLALRAALARRRAIWFTRLFDSGVVWREAGDSCARLIVIENGEIALSAAVDASAPPPIPPGYRRPMTARREAFTLASFDRLRVLTTELKRLIAAGAPVALRLGVGPTLDEPRLAFALWWV